MRHLAIIISLCLCALCLPVRADDMDHAGAEKLGWKLSLQAWTNNKKTLFETLELAQSIGVHHIEMYTKQKLAPDIDAQSGLNMTDEQIQKTLDKAKSCDVKIITCGVIRIPSDEAGARKVFDWAKKMGLSYLNAEPEEKALPMINKLAGEFGITVGLHDHPKPARYWNPAHVAEVTKGLDHVGFCADTGHWKRSGMVPVEVIKQYGDKIVTSHFKDLVPGGGSHGFHDVIWGTGQSNAADQLAALKAHHFHGPISIEYEWKWTPDDLRACVKFFYAEANKLAAE